MREKTVGLFRAIKPEWLNKTAELVIEGHDHTTIKTMLDDYLSYEIESAINRGKTIQLLMNIWVRPEATSHTVHQKAIAAFKREQSDKIALGWALLILAHPLFADASGFIGKVTTVQNTFTTSWLKEKICEAHGERPTLIRAVSGVLETMRHHGCIDQESVGVYRIVKRSVKDEQTISVLLLCLLMLNKKAYYNISELSNVPMFFPFEYEATLGLLHKSPEFCLSNFGGKTVVTAANHFT